MKDLKEKSTNLKVIIDKLKVKLKNFKVTINCIKAKIKTKDINNRYNSNTFNTSEEPKKDFNKLNEKESEISNNRDKKDNNTKEDNSKKYKLLPRLYTGNNFKKRRNFIENKKEESE